DEYGANRMLRTERWKLVLRREGPTELYDLQEDPGELRDLSTDPAYGDTLRELTGALEDWFARRSTEALDGWDSAVDGTGQTAPVAPQSRQEKTHDAQRRPCSTRHPADRLGRSRIRRPLCPPHPGR